MNPPGDDGKGTGTTVNKPNLMVFVGDHSADVFTARVFDRLMQYMPDLHIWGVGGTKMKETAMEQLYDSSDFAVLGIFQVVHKLAFFYKMRQHLLDEISRRKPDLILLVDNGGFNIQFANAIRKINKDVPIYYFISPQIWGSRPWRINAMKSLTKVLTIFPFEPPIYRAKGIEATFVGNTAAGTMTPPEQLPTKEDLCSKYGLDPERPIITVFPGSRKQEVRSFMPVLLEAIAMMNAERPEVQFCISRSTIKAGAIIEDAFKKVENKLQGAVLVDQPDTLWATKASKLAWVKSGTSTLEVAMLGKPMIIYYRGPWPDFLLVMAFKTVKNVGMPNILAGKTLIPELIQLDCRAQLLVRYSLDLFDVPARYAEIESQLAQIRHAVGSEDFVENTARELMAVLENPALCQSKS